MNLDKTLSKAFPNSIRAQNHDIRHGTNFSGINNRKVRDEKRSKSVFKTDPFFNPFAPGGKFNKFGI